MDLKEDLFTENKNAWLSYAAWGTFVFFIIIKLIEVL